ncbi:MAG: glycosyltransferase family 39 protein [Chloroflexi bacterium]|nr:glycosyltransferase family 39 protein [Chloroflexota bacterium]
MNLTSLKKKLCSWQSPWLLGGILLLALALRLYGLDWDQGQLYHPDERAIFMKVEGLRLPTSLDQFLSRDSPLNPQWFPYGSFPLYLLKLVSSLFSSVDTRLVGRALTGLFDVGTVLLVYLLAARLWGRRVGLLAAALSAVTVLQVQLSHFYTSDVMLTTFAVATLLFLARGLEKRDSLSALLAGVAMGLALASKASAAFLALPILAAYVLQATTGPERPLGDRLRVALGGLLVTGAAAGLTAAIAQPYALLDWPTYFVDTLRESQMARRIIDMPYTRQYINTPAYLYPIQQLVTWGMGLPLGLAALGGVVYSLWQGAVRRQRNDLLLLAWVVPYFLLVGGFQVKFLRYMLPLAPFLTIMAARGLLATRDWMALRQTQGQTKGAGRWPWPPRTWATVAIALVVGLSALYAVAYVNMYRQPHPAVRLARWAQANLPPGSRVVWEIWDEGLRPMGFGGLEVDPYNDDSPEKLDRTLKVLEQASHIYLFSNRMYGTIPRLPERYPMTTRYYQMLFSGELGFKLVRTEVSYPHLPGLDLVDNTFSRPGLTSPEGISRFLPGSLSLDLGYADESFTVYDHPKAMLFQKTADFDPSEVRRKLGAALATQRNGRAPGLVLSPQRAQWQQAGGTWTAIFPQNGLGERFPIVVWVLLVEVVALTALPLGWRLFQGLADRGYLLTKALSLLLLAFVPWWLASLGWLPFSRGSILLGWAFLAAASAAVVARYGSELRAFVRGHWKLLLAQEALFLLAFAGFLALRAANPDLWHMYRGGEKPMDFAYLNAVIRSSYMPPYDPWFAGGYLNYYYLGQYLAAVPMKLSGIRPEVAYNLAVPLFFALTVAGAFSVVFALVRASRGRARSAFLAGVAAAAFVAVLGNLDGLLQVKDEMLARVFDAATPMFDYWRSSRMMPPDPPGFEITEFPFFTFLFADLHAHLLALPFTLLAIGLSVALGLQQAPAGLAGLRRQVPLLLALALVLGALRGINSWDFPTYLLLAGGALFIAEHCVRRRLAPSTGSGQVLVSLGWTALKLAGLYVASTLLWLPFHQSFALFYGGVTFSQDRTAIYQYLLVHGMFVFLALSFVAWETWRKPVAALRGPWRASILAGALVFALALFFMGWTAAAFLLFVEATILVLAATWLATPFGAHRSRLLVLAFIALGAALGVGVDLVTLKGDISRMNTVFKFYLQGWVLWGLASAFALWWLARRIGHWPAPGRTLWLGAAVVLVAATAIYPVLGTRARLSDRFAKLPPTLDGMAYMEGSTYQYPGWCKVEGTVSFSTDREVINWLRKNVPGSPVVAEAATPIYCWGSRVSVYTGLPTIIGWEWHQRQQRWGYQWMVDERLRDVDILYRTGDVGTARSILEKYGVRYVVVGQVERLYYPAQGLAKFDSMPNTRLVYDQPGARVYEVAG